MMNGSNISTYYAVMCDERTRAHPQMCVVTFESSFLSSMHCLSK